MSWKATAWAKESRGHHSQSQKFLLMVLADYAHPETNRCWPSLSTLAENCMMSVRSVIRHMNSLEKQGFVTREKRGNQYGTSVYLMNLDMIDVSVRANMSRANSDVSYPDLSQAQESEESVGDTSDVVVSDTDDNARDTSDIVVSDITIAHKPQEPSIESQEPPVNNIRVRKRQQIDTSLIEAMQEKYPDLDVEAEISAALNHKSVDKAKDKSLYVQTWLRRAAKWAEERQAKGSPRARRPAIDPNPDTYSFFGGRKEVDDGESSIPESQIRDISAEGNRK